MPTRAEPDSDLNGAELSTFRANLAEFEHVRYLICSSFKHLTLLTRPWDVIQHLRGRRQALRYSNQTHAG
jgi:hypothetical protein